MATYDELKQRQIPSNKQKNKCKVELLKSFLKSFETAMDPQVMKDTHHVQVRDLHEKKLYGQFVEWVIGPRTGWTDMSFPEECNNVLDELDVKSVVADLQDKGFDVAVGATTFNVEVNGSKKDRPGLQITTNLTRKYAGSRNTPVQDSNLYYAANGVLKAGGVLFVLGAGYFLGAHGSTLLSRDQSEN